MYLKGPAQWFYDDFSGPLSDISGSLLYKVVTEEELQRLPKPHIYIYIEPFAVDPFSFKYLMNFGSLFDKVLTFDKVLLENLENAKCLLFGTCTVSRSIINNTHDIIKTGIDNTNISFVCGSKNWTPGHLIRRAIYNNQMFIETQTGLQLSFWRSSRDEILPEVCPRGNPILYNKKEDLHLPFKYSIIIENSQQPNYFTEKLIDCLICKTVPIYWGCPNIENFFNTRGFIILNGDEVELSHTIGKQLLRCTNEFYESIQDIIVENYNTALKYAYNYPTRVRDIILST